MIRHVALALLLCASLVMAEPASSKSPTTRPTTPTTKPTSGEKSADKKEATKGADSKETSSAKSGGKNAPHAGDTAKKPVTKPVEAKGGEPQRQLTPAELMAKIKDRQSAVDKLPKVGHISLHEEILERSPEFTLFGDHNLITLPALLDRLHKARDDKNLRAVLVTLGETSFNTAQAMEIRKAMDELRRAGKRTFVYADSFDTTAYLAACSATDICMLSGGEIMMTGVSIEPMFAKGLFDKLGVKADMIQIGEFKGADEQYTRTELSPEARGELNKIADGLYGLITSTIAQSRNVKQQAVKQIIDDVFLPAKRAKELKLIDHLKSQDDLRELLAEELGGEVNILANYAVEEKEKLDLSNPLALFQQMLTKKGHGEADGKGLKPVIAVIHAQGVIVDGEVEESILGGSGNVGSENLRKAVRLASRDDDVKAIVLRIDSPGGSAMASEVMWQAVNSAAADKPVIVSVGSMAASGGYYLASAGDYIFADASSIVGSIGVVGGKFVLSGLFDKVGISTDSITRGKNADLFSMNKEWNDRQRRMVTNWMKNTYDQFTERVMENRKDKIKDIDKVARGRIFMAKQAKDLGLVDEIGGLSEAIAFAAKEADVKEYEVKMLPESRSLLDLLTGASSIEDDEAKLQLQSRLKVKLTADSPFLSLPPAVRKMIGRQMQFMQIMEKRPVMLVAPVEIRVK